jgi:hypothetical protein
LESEAKYLARISGGTKSADDVGVTSRDDLSFDSVVDVVEAVSDASVTAALEATTSGSTNSGSTDFNSSSLTP